MGLISRNFPEFTAAFSNLDDTLYDANPFDPKMVELFSFALSIKGRSAPCVRKHYRGARAAGATDQELAFVFALTMREAAGADECWTAATLSDLLPEE